MGWNGSDGRYPGSGGQWEITVADPANEPISFGHGGTEPAGPTSATAWWTQTILNGTLQYVPDNLVVKPGRPMISCPRIFGAAAEVSAHAFRVVCCSADRSSYTARGDQFPCHGFADHARYPAKLSSSRFNLSFGGQIAPSVGHASRRCGKSNGE